jgi:hypothetical protein
MYQYLSLAARAKTLKRLTARYGANSSKAAAKAP